MVVAFSRILGIVLVGSILVPGLTLAQNQLSGQTTSGAYYQIQVPIDWQPADGLVIWNHGFDLNPIGPVEDLGPLVLLQLSQGYAVAASSYSQSGWAMFQTLEDNRQMVAIFEQNFGVPDEVLLYGASLGGLVTAQSVEQGGLGNVVGAYPLCGAVGGSRIWDSAFDLRLIYDYTCGEVPGAALPGGATGLPASPDPNIDSNAVIQAVNICTGVALPPSARSAEQAARLNQLIELSHLPPEFLLTDMFFSTLAMSDLLLSPEKMAGGQALGNTRVDYGDAAVNAGIERVAIDPEARTRFLKNYTPNGGVGDVKIVSIHTDKDGLVVVENETEYASKVPAANLTVGIVVEDEPSHCLFTIAELVAGWEALRAWVGGSAQPTSAQLQQVCEGVAAQGLPGPCRIDPNFVLPDLTDRVRERDICEADADTLCLNDGRFRVEVTWRDFEGGSGPGQRVAAGTPDSGLMWFFSPDNWEMLIKVLDGCSINEHYWVFAASTTNVGFDLVVTDTLTGAQKTYTNPIGTSADAITDTQAFATCP